MIYLYHTLLPCFFQVRERPSDIHRILQNGLRAQPGEGGLPRGAGADGDGRARGEPVLLIAAGQEIARSRHLSLPTFQCSLSNDDIKQS